MENNLEDKSSKTLAAIVIAFRILGLNKEQSIKAMEILSERENVGDDFDYKKYINDIVLTAPKPKTPKKNPLGNMLKPAHLELLFKNMLDKDE